jgi:hypothetical protein
VSQIPVHRRPSRLGRRSAAALPLIKRWLEPKTCWAADNLFSKGKHIFQVKELRFGLPELNLNGLDGLSRSSCAF